MRHDSSVDVTIPVSTSSCQPPMAPMLPALASSAWLSRSAASTRRRSLMSRSVAVKNSPSSVLTGVIVSSTGNTVPSARMASVSMRRFSTWGMPVCW